MNIIKYYPYTNALYNFRDLKVGSTTLFGALSNMWILFYGDENIDEFFKGYERGEILISSLFPFIYDKKEDTIFYPRPILKGKYEDTQEVPTKEIKKLKKVRFLSEKLLAKLIASIKKEGEGYYYTLSFFDKNIVLEPPFAYLKDEKISEDFQYDFVNFPHLKVDRFNTTHEGEGGFFYGQNLTISGNLGFYFLCKCSPSWEERILPLFRLLADEGIGGKRTKGKGLFRNTKIEKHHISLPKNELYIGLSLVFPEESEKPYIYSMDLEKDDGFVYYGRPISLKKSPLYLIKEGAMYRDKIKGCLLKESSGNIEIYRNGMAFLIGGEE